VDVLRTAGSFLILLSLAQLCGAAAVGLIVLLLHRPAAASSREGA